MYKKIPIVSLLLSALAALVVGGSIAVYILGSSSASSAMASPIAQPVISTQSTSTLPMRLVIPTLGINAAVQRVGLTAAGSMGDPSNFTDVAWYKNGPVPGAQGSAVIGGHLDNALALNGVFKYLDELEVGQEVEVQTEAGNTLTFRVTDVEEYPYQQVPETIFTKTGGAYLNLITCAGTWLPAEHSYDKRLVVYTTLVT